MKKAIRKPLAAALGTAMVSSLVLVGNVQAADNPFEMTKLDSGYVVASSGKPEGEGKCGEGKCGSSKKGEGKCGEGKCGSSKKGEGKCGEGKCGSSKKGEGKCGEGKCGSNK